MIMSLKQRKIKFEPSIKLNHSIDVLTYFRWGRDYCFDFSSLENVHAEHLTVI